MSELKNAMTRGDGSLFELKKTTSDGRILYVTTRYIDNPRGNPSKVIGADRRFYKWNYFIDDFATGVLLVNLYGQKNGEMKPLGHMDWWLQIDYADGSDNLQDAAIPQNEYEQEARKIWTGSLAMRVDSDYRKQKLGSLMLAISAVTLPVIGARKFYIGGLLTQSRKMYEKFGIKPEDFPPGAPYQRYLPIERLSQHPEAENIIAEFIS